MTEKTQNLINTLPPELIVIDKLIRIAESGTIEYKIRNEDWGTELDWKIQLWFSPDSSFIRNFFQCLREIGVFVENRKVIKNNKAYETYKLAKNWKRILQINFIETLPYVIWLEKTRLYELQREKG